MYEKDEDEYNVGLQFKMAKGAFKRDSSTRAVPNSQSAITNNIVSPFTDAIIDRGAKQFTGHEDVIKKLLG